jgi:hypothetical protein
MHSLPPPIHALRIEGFEVESLCYIALFGRKGDRMKRRLRVLKSDEYRLSGAGNRVEHRVIWVQGGRVISALLRPVDRRMT